jgi:hypothetical protein
MMKHNIKYVMALVFMLLMTQGAWADPTVTIIKQLNGSAVTTTSPGEVTSEIENSKCTLTVTPAYGYYVTSEYITAYSVVTGDVSQAPQRRSPNLDNNPITVTPVGDHNDPSAVTQYTLPMPADGSDVEVTVNFQAAQMYGLSIGGVEVSEFNFENVLKDGKVSFNVETNMLTLNGATINGGIVSNLEVGLTVHLLGENVIDAQESYAFASGITTSYLPLEFTTNETTPGQLLIKNGLFSSGSYQYQSHFSPSFSNGLAIGTEGDKWLIDVAPVMTPVEGLYWTDQLFTISGKSGDALYYKNNLNSTEQAYTEPFTLTAGKYSLSALRKVVKDETTFSLFGQANQYIVHNKPGFSEESGTYNGTQNITLTNLPENLSSEGYPQVWYYIGENETDSVQVTSAEQNIPVTESTKVCVYFIDEDSGKVAKSETVQAEYTILKEPELHFWKSENSYMQTGGVYGTINFSELEEFSSPTLKAKMGENYTSNLTDLGITYSTSDETVATVDATGKVTIVGGGYVTIKAVSQQTDVYAADSTWYEIAVRPNAPQISLEKGVYYTGTKVGLNATMPNGKMYYKIGDNDTPTEYTDSITLPVGTNEIIAYTYCGTGEKIMESYGGRMVFFVYDKPQFSVASGTYNDTQEVTITTNIPDNDPYVALYYKLNNSQTDSTLYKAGDKITIAETTKVCAYYWVQESDKYVSDPIEAHYVIRQDAGLAFVRDGEYVEVAEYTIGGKENLPLPELQNENELTVTYSSEDTSVATIDEEGEVTIVGIGETLISATSEQTDVLLEGYAAYPLRVFKDLNYESITVSVADATYTGEAVTPVVTVMDGETDISAFFDFAYSNNVQVGTNAKVTISPKELTDANNYYVGERTESFTINNRTLEVGKDVQFAEGQKWASLYTTTEDLNLPEGVMAYIVTEVSATTVTVKAIRYVPMNVPVLLENGSTVTTENTSAEGNMLRGTSEQTTVSSILGNVFGLYNNKLMRVTSGSIPAGRAYLVTDEPQARELSIIFDADITGIRMAKVGAADDDNWYTIDGRKLQQKPVKKGVYIKNGHKILVK